MALVKCPECGNSVSDRAESCPKCAYPIAGSWVGTKQVRGSKLVTIEQTAKPGWLAKSLAENKQRWDKKTPEQRLAITRRVWFAVVVVGALIAALFAPAIPLWFGIILLVLCLGAFLKTGADVLRLSERISTTTTIGKIVSHVLAVLPIVQNFSRRLLRLNSSEKWRSGVRLAGYGLVGLVLIVAGRTGAGYKADRERNAAKHKAEEAEQRRLANEANAKVDALVADATKAVKAGDIDAARAKVKDALAIPQANALTEARNLKQKIDNATDPTRIRAALMELSDENFKALKESGTMPAQMVSGYEGLDRRTVELAKAEVERVAEARENRRLAQLEAERKRQEEAGSFKNDSIKTICSYLVEAGHKTGTYKQMDGDDYFACSPYKSIGDGFSTNNIAYYVEGTRKKVRKVYLTLNVNNSAGRKLAHTELLSTGNTLVEKATGSPLPNEARAGIDEGTTGQWRIGGVTVKLSRDDFPTGKGYSLTLLIE